MHGPHHVAPKDTPAGRPRRRSGAEQSLPPPHRGDNCLTGGGGRKPPKQKQMRLLWRLCCRMGCKSSKKGSTGRRQVSRGAGPGQHRGAFLEDLRGEGVVPGPPHGPERRQPTGRPQPRLPALRRGDTVRGERGGSNRLLNQLLNRSRMCRVPRWTADRTSRMVPAHISHKAVVLGCRVERFANKEMRNDRGTFMRPNHPPPLWRPGEPRLASGLGPRSLPPPGAAARA